MMRQRPLRDVQFVQNFASAHSAVLRQQTYDMYPRAIPQRFEQLYRILVVHRKPHIDRYQYVSTDFEESQLNLQLLRNLFFHRCMSLLSTFTFCRQREPKVAELF